MSFRAVWVMSCTVLSGVHVENQAHGQLHGTDHMAQRMLVKGAIQAAAAQAWIICHFLQLEVVMSSPLWAAPWWLALVFPPSML